jgi:hypothetical protein
MNNTTRYRVVSNDGEVIFRAYFHPNGGITADQDTIRGFWHVDERDYFCYALYGLPTKPSQWVECFPVVAMSIPRFAEQLWESRVEGITAYGGFCRAAVDIGKKDPAGGRGP